MHRTLVGYNVEISLKIRWNVDGGTSQRYSDLVLQVFVQYQQRDVDFICNIHVASTLIECYNMIDEHWKNFQVHTMKMSFIYYGFAKSMVLILLESIDLHARYFHRVGILQLLWKLKIHSKFKIGAYNFFTMDLLFFQMR